MIMQEVIPTPMPNPPSSQRDQGTSHPEACAAAYAVTCDLRLSFPHSQINHVQPQGQPQAHLTAQTITREPVTSSRAHANHQAPATKSQVNQST